MVFTIQFCKEFAKVGLKNAIGGLLDWRSRASSRGNLRHRAHGTIGSSIAAELGTMQVTEQVDQLTVLGTDPVDYLVIPRVIACAVSFPSSASSPSPNPWASIFSRIYATESRRTSPDSAAKYLEASDIGIMTAKSIAFGAVIAVISCGWGTTTTGGAKGVGRAPPRASLSASPPSSSSISSSLASSKSDPTVIDRSLHPPPPVVSRET